MGKLASLVRANSAALLAPIEIYPLILPLHRS
jgi:hypothetical protein